jgi:amidophosphoribosyltransferase
MSGIYGVVSKGDCADILLYGTDYHSHLGTEFGGLAVFDRDFARQIHNISQTQFKSKFFEDAKKMKGNKGIGVISAFEEQPIYLNCRFGPFCVVTNGFIENKEELAARLMARGHAFTEVTKSGVNATELIAKMISEGRDLIDGIEKMSAAIEGSCSLLILTGDGVYAARDRLGYTPLVVGKRKDAWAVASETSAFPNSDFDIVKYLEPGEIVLLSEKGMAPRRKGSSSNQICSFLWIYTGFPSSNYEGINTEIVRERCGRCLAKRDKDIKVDVVTGVPDSGLAHAIGYAMESGKPFRRPLVKYTPGYGRSYTPPSQETRDLIAKMKLIPIKEIIEGNSVVVCEDSIVRGTQLKNFTIKKLWDGKAKEVHIRPACPPLMFPCRFNFSTRSINELAARRAIRALEGRDIEDVSGYVDHTSARYRKMVDWITKDLEVTTLRYQTVDDMVRSIGLPREKLCLYCWTGECPGKGKKGKEGEIRGKKGIRGVDKGLEGEIRGKKGIRGVDKGLEGEIRGKTGIKEVTCCKLRP